MCIFITVEETISIKLDLMQHGIGKETKYLKNKYTWYPKCYRASVWTQTEEHGYSM